VFSFGYAESMVVDQVVCMEPRYGEVIADVSQLQAHTANYHIVMSFVMYVAYPY
jgi:hypothetical protein